MTSGFASTVLPRWHQTFTIPVKDLGSELAAFLEVTEQVVPNTPCVVAIFSLIGPAQRQGASSRLLTWDQGAHSGEGGAVAVEMLRSCTKGSKTRIEWDTQDCYAYAVGA